MVRSQEEASLCFLARFKFDLLEPRFLKLVLNLDRFSHVDSDNDDPSDELEVWTRCWDAWISADRHELPSRASRFGEIVSNTIETEVMKRGLTRNRT